MKKWKYKYFNESTGFIEDGKDHKIGVVWGGDSPDADYEDVTTEAELLGYKANLYVQREKDGTEFSNIMNAKLDDLSANFFDAPTMTYLKGVFNTDEDGIVELAKDEIDTFFAQTQFFLEKGKFKSAQREMNKLDYTITTFVNESTYLEIKSFIDNYVINSYI